MRLNYFRFATYANITFRHFTALPTAKPPSSFAHAWYKQWNMEFLQLSGPLLDIFLFFSKTKIFHSHPCICKNVLQMCVCTHVHICTCVCVHMFALCVCACACVCVGNTTTYISRVSNQNGISLQWFVVKIYHSSQKSLICLVRTVTPFVLST